MLVKICRYIVTGLGGMEATAEFWGGPNGYLAFLLEMFRGARDDPTSALHGVVEGAATSFVFLELSPFIWLSSCKPSHTLYR